MSSARLGDEQAGEDPTVRELEAELAGVLGQEAAIFVPSATMANVIALLCQVRPGEEVLGHEHGHLFRWRGLVARHWLARCSPGCPAATDGSPGAWFGIMRSSLTRRASRRAVSSSSRTRTTRQAAGRGRCPSWMPSTTPAGNSASPCTSTAHACLNAATAARVPPSRISAAARSVTICFSKGLGCPAGAALAGPAEALRPGRPDQADAGWLHAPGRCPGCCRALRATPQRRPARRRPRRRPTARRAAAQRPACR